MPALQGYTMGTYKEEKVNEAIARPLDSKSKISGRRTKGQSSPGTPTNVRLHVTGDTCLTVQFGSVDNGFPATHFKVEWSMDPNFDLVVGHALIEDNGNNLEYEIKGLQRGQAYFVRVCACGSLGRGAAVSSTPACATPSSWREVEKVQPRGKGDERFLARLFRDYGHMVLADQTKMEVTGLMPSSVASKGLGAKRGWRGIFTNTLKFKKSLKRGLYFMCIFYHEDQVLVTNYEYIPVVSVDSTVIAGDRALQPELQYLMKLSQAWDTVEDLKDKIERLVDSASTLELRLKLLRAVSLLQATLGTQDLGHVFYKIVESEGCEGVAFVLVNRIKDIKGVDLSQVKWSSLTRLQKRQVPFIDRLSDFICYHQVSSFPLGRGLYLGLMMTHIGIDSIQFLVNAATPNVLPHVKLRSRPHVSKDEWQAISGSSSPSSPDAKQFALLVVNGFATLAKALGISQECSLSYRLCHSEVLECSSDVSFLVIVPPRDLLCTIQASGSQTAVQANLIHLPLKVFELIHLATFVPSLLHAYSKMTCLMDMDAQLANQAIRNTFTNEEAATLQAHLNNILWYQQQVEDRWQLLRWPSGIMAYARDKANRGIPLARLLADFADLSAAALEPESGSRRPGQRPQPEGSSPEEHTSSLQLDAGSSGTECIVMTRRPQSRRREQDQLVPLQTAIVRVYADYECGLTSGTSVVIHVSHKTTCREIVNLVVRRLDQEVQLRLLDVPSPAAAKMAANACHDDASLQRFCLVVQCPDNAVILRDSASLLAWRHLWLPNHLCVRLKDDMNADLEGAPTRLTAL